LNATPILTILMVAGPGDEALVKRNIEHIARNNPCANYEIHVMDNGYFHGHASISIDLPLVFLRPGEPTDLSKPESCRGSYQHAAALNRFIHEQNFKTRHLVILDPDFFIIKENWIADVCKHIETNKLWFFGATWHPKWITKYRYFPCIHCMFIDTNNIKCQELDFTPNVVDRNIKKAEIKAKKEISREEAAVASGRWFKVFLDRINKTLNLLCCAYVDAKKPIPLSLRLMVRFMIIFDLWRNWSSFFKTMTESRGKIGESDDTGYLVDILCRNNKGNSETLVPFLDLKNDGSKIYYLETILGGLIEKISPDRWSYIPKRPGSFTKRNFKKCGLPNPSELNWEEYFWFDVPFAFHMRRANKQKGDRDFEHEERLLEALLAPR
jgi:hypothetical protein